jgi:hypothetical protein
MEAERVSFAVIFCGRIVIFHIELLVVFEGTVNKLRYRDNKNMENVDFLKLFEEKAKAHLFDLNISEEYLLIISLTYAKRYSSKYLKHFLSNNKMEEGVKLVEYLEKAAYEKLKAIDISINIDALIDELLFFIPDSEDYPNDSLALGAGILLENVLLKIWGRDIPFNYIFDCYSDIIANELQEQQNNGKEDSLLLNEECTKFSELYNALTIQNGNIDIIALTNFLL